MPRELVAPNVNCWILWCCYCQVLLALYPGQTAAGSSGSPSPQLCAQCFNRCTVEKARSWATQLSREFVGRGCNHPQSLLRQILLSLLPFLLFTTSPTLETLNASQCCRRLPSQHWGATACWTCMCWTCAGAPYTQSTINVLYGTFMSPKSMLSSSTRVTEFKIGL